MENREITREPYRYGYQGQFSEKDLTTGMQEFELRLYDPRIGRWTTMDPYGQFASPYIGMGNIPQIGADPNGGVCCVTFIEGIGYMGDEFIAVEAARIGSIAGRLPAIVASTVSAIPNGLMYKGGDGSWYATYPTIEGSYTLKHENGEWQMHSDEPQSNKNNWDNLLLAHEKILDLNTTLIMGAMGGMAEGGMEAASLRSFADDGVKSLVNEGVDVKLNSSAGTNSLVKSTTEISKHAVGRFAERGVTKKMVQTALSKGTKYYDPKNKTINYLLKNGFGSGKDLLVGINPLTGKIATVIRGKNLFNARFIPL